MTDTQSKQGTKKDGRKVLVEVCEQTIDTLRNYMKKRKDVIQPDALEEEFKIDNDPTRFTDEEYCKSVFKEVSKLLKLFRANFKYLVDRVKETQF